MTISINDFIKVKLTEHGKRIHFEYYYKYITDSLPIEGCLPKIDKDGYTEYQLWIFANIFGNHFCNGGKSILEKNEIIVEHNPYDILQAGGT